MQRGQRIGHGQVDGAAFGRGHAWQIVGVEHASFDLLHQIERRADHIVLGVIEQHLRHRQPRRCQRFHHTVLTIDRMGRRQHITSRLLAQHHVTAAVTHKKCRVGLTTTNGLQFQIAIQGWQLRTQKAVKAGGVKRCCGRR